VTSAPPFVPATDMAREPGPGASAEARTGLPRSVFDIAALACLVALMVRVTIHAGQPLDNGDTWFHLRIGHELWGDWSLAHPGQLSSFASSSWVPTQWSTELLMAKLEDWFGLPGVAVFYGALFLALILGVYLLCRRYCGPLGSTVATGFAVIGCGPSLSARPQVVSLILFVVVVAAWLRAGRDLRVPWLLVPLTWVWATAHGLWSAGVIVGVVACVAIFLDRRPDRRTTIQLAAVPALSVVAACLTPLGPRLLTSQAAVGARTSMIGEWQPTSFRDVPAFVVGVMIAVVVLRWGRSREVPWLHLLLLMLAAGWTALVNRMVGFGGVLAAPLLATALQQLLDSTAPRRRINRVEAVAVGGGALACLLGLLLVAPHSAQHPGGVPSRFTSRLATLPSGTPVAVEDYTGAWMEWRFPGLDPMIDGMLDAYPVSYIRGFDDFRSLQPGWQGFLSRSGAQDAVLVAHSPLSAAMQDQLHWQVVAHDGGWVYLVAPGSHQ
jgi:hypothetical protein